MKRQSWPSARSSLADEASEGVGHDEPEAAPEPLQAHSRSFTAWEAVRMQVRRCIRQPDRKRGSVVP